MYAIRSYYGGITRTTLYLYFKNKREIFVWSIKQLTGGVEQALRGVIENENATYAARLEAFMHLIIDQCTNNRRLFTVVLTYLLAAQKSGKDPESRVKRRTIRLRHLLSQLLIAGKKSGEFRDFNVKDANELLYGLIESTIYRIAILDRSEASEMKEAISLVVTGLVRV